MDVFGSIIDALKFAALRLLLVADAAHRFFGRATPAVLRRVPGAIPSGSRKILCIFAHFDRDAAVDDYVVYHLKALDAIGCEIVFVTTAEDLGPEQIEKVRPYCRSVIVRENIGYDFGSWKVGLAEVIDLSRYDRLVIANDSVYGPMFDLREAFARMAKNSVDFWGITDSRRYRHHLQSYFLVFERTILDSTAFARFWRRFPYYRYKHSVILAGEIGLSRMLARAGFRFRALCPCDEVWYRHRALRPGARRPRSPRANPSHWFWDILLRDFRCPFLKVQLIRDNPKRVPSVDRWNEVIAQGSGYDAGLIRRHRSRIAATAG